MMEKTSVSVSYTDEELAALKKATGKEKNHEAVREAVRMGLDFIRKAEEGGGDANSVDSVIVVKGGVYCNAGEHPDGEAAKEVFDQLCLKQGRCDTCRYSQGAFKKTHAGRPCTVTCFTRWLCDAPSENLRA